MSKPKPLPEKFARLTVHRFWRQVERRQWNQCWPWKGEVHKKYGRFTIDGQHYKAHRIMFRLHHDGLVPPVPTMTGPVRPENKSKPAKKGANISEDLIVRHACDNPLCCNPRHLQLGTQLENIQDRVARSRSAKKLTKALVVQIRRRARAGESYTSLAKELGLGQPTVFQAAVGDTWQHVAEPTVPRQRRKKASGK